jgi:hypothetical protein
MKKLILYISIPVIGYVFYYTMRGFVVCSLYLIFLGLNQGGLDGGECRKNGENKKCMDNIFSETSTEETTREI